MQGFESVFDFLPLGSDQVVFPFLGIAFQIQRIILLSRKLAGFDAEGHTRHIDTDRNAAGRPFPGEKGFGFEDNGSLHLVAVTFTGFHGLELVLGNGLFLFDKLGIEGDVGFSNHFLSLHFIILLVSAHAGRQNKCAKKRQSGFSIHGVTLPAEIGQRT